MRIVINVSIYTDDYGYRPDAEATIEVRAPEFLELSPVESLAGDAVFQAWRKYCEVYRRSVEDEQAKGTGEESTGTAGES